MCKQHTELGFVRAALCVYAAKQVAAIQVGSRQSFDCHQPLYRLYLRCLQGAVALRQRRLTRLAHPRRKLL